MVESTDWPVLVLVNGMKGGSHGDRPLGLGLSSGRGEAGTGGPGAVGTPWNAAGAEALRGTMGD